MPGKLRLAILVKLNSSRLGRSNSLIRPIVLFLSDSVPLSQTRPLAPPHYSRTPECRWGGYSERPDKFLSKIAMMSVRVRTKPCGSDAEVSWNELECPYI